MATSTRRRALELWPLAVPLEKPEKLDRILFRYDNPPSQKDVSGSQDSIGMMMPGINRLYYEKGEYWPASIESILDEETLQWVEGHLFFHFLWPRPQEYDPLKNTIFQKQKCKNCRSSRWRLGCNKKERYQNVWKIFFGFFSCTNRHVPGYDQ